MNHNREMKKVLGLPVSREINIARLGFGAGATPAGRCLLILTQKEERFSLQFLLQHFDFIRVSCPSTNLRLLNLSLCNEAKRSFHLKEV